MATYVYKSSGSVGTSANIATDKVRISTTSNSILFAVGYPNTSATGTVTTTVASPTVTGVGTTFLTQLNKGYWIGNATGVTVGIVSSIANNTSMTLTANANVAITGGVMKYSPYGAPYVDDVLNSSNCPRASGIVPANTILNDVYVGQGNVITFINAETGNCTFSVSELGMPYANTGTTGF